MTGPKLTQYWSRWRRKRRAKYLRAGATSLQAESGSRLEAVPGHRVAHCPDPVARPLRFRETGSRERGYFVHLQPEK